LAERRLVGAAGDVTLRRRYFTGRRCGRHAHPLDERLGPEGLVSPHAQRLLCLVGAEHSFGRSARLLREVAGPCVCDDTVRRICDAHGGRMRARQREDPEAARPFREADGEVGFQADGTSVNTTAGRREMRPAIFAERPRGEPVRDLDAWDAGRPPEPTARVAGAATRTSKALGPQWRRTAARPGVERTAESSVPADGAKWIWNEVETNLPGAAGVLDVVHASEHLHAAAVARHGETPAAEAWYEARRRTLLGRGAVGVREELAAEPGPDAGLAGFLAPHVDHTPYRGRLAEGRSIGSGLVEGACKTTIGRRLKQTGARWRVRRVERMAALCCPVYGEQFDAYWRQVAS
jgi:hypothetical protein